MLAADSKLRLVSALLVSAFLSPEIVLKSLKLNQGQVQPGPLYCVIKLFGINCPTAETGNWKAEDGAPISPLPLGRMEKGKLQQKRQQILKQQGRRRGGDTGRHSYLIWGFTTDFTICFIRSELTFYRVPFSTNFPCQRTEYNPKYFFCIKCIPYY